MIKHSYTEKKLINEEEDPHIPSFYDIIDKFMPKAKEALARVEKKHAECMVITDEEKAEMNPKSIYPQYQSDVGIKLGKGYFLSSGAEFFWNEPRYIKLKEKWQKVLFDLEQLEDMYYDLETDMLSSKQQQDDYAGVQDYVRRRDGERKKQAYLAKKAEADRLAQQGQ